MAEYKWDADAQHWVSKRGTILPDHVQRHLNLLHGKNVDEPSEPVAAPPAGSPELDAEIHTKQAA